MSEITNLMPEENIFKDRTIITIIPFIAAIYLSFIDSVLRLVCFILAINVIVYYLIIMALAKDVQFTNSKEERDVYRSIVNKKNIFLSGITAIMQWIVGIITLWLLYFHLQDILVYTLFWLLIAGTIFNLLRLFVVHFDTIRDSFLGKPGNLSLN
jgi:hypothetical protein